jgi:hypothetical protein
MKIWQLRTELFHVDRLMDMTKLTVDFRNFADTPQKELHSFAVIGYRKDSSGYTGQIGPSGKYFLTVTVPHLFMA